MKMSAYLITASLLLFFIFSACTIDDNSPEPSGSVPDTFQNGIWRITVFSDSDEDEAYHFTGYAFTFDSTGIVTAIKDSSAVNGAWNFAKDDDSNDFIIDFGSNVPFNELNDDWHIVENTAIKIKLEEVCEENEPPDLLTFEKN